MQILPKVNTLRKGSLLYRGIRYRKGFGVHSPFVFNLITKVIEEKCSYYSFYDIELLRKQLLFREGEITYPDRQNKGKRKTRSIGEIVKRESIRPKHGALLFRLTNYFKSKNILQIGTTMGLSTLYLTSYATGLRCIALENVPVFVFGGIKASRKMRELWEEICACPEVTVTLDLYSLGIVLFNKKLHKRDYIVYF